MSAKRPALSLKADAFAAHAIPQPDPVQVATAHPPAMPPAAEARKPAQRRAGEQTSKKAANAAGQPSRAGKVQVVAWVPEGRRAELKIVAAKLRRTVDDLLTSMIDDLVTKNLGS